MDVPSWRIWAGSRVAVKYGAAVFVLQGHVPYTRQIGPWLHGEILAPRRDRRDVHPAVLDALRPGRARGARPGRRSASRPVLAEQLGDPLVAQHFETYLLERAERAAQDVGRFERAGDLHARYLAHWYEDFYDRTLAVFRGASTATWWAPPGGSRTAATWRSRRPAATHGYLPLLSPGVVGGGAGEHGRPNVPRAFRGDPKAIWLPETGLAGASRTAGRAGPVALLRRDPRAGRRAAGSARR